MALIIVSHSPLIASIFGHNVYSSTTTEQFFLPPLPSDGRIQPIFAMSGIDVEALLESTAAPAAPPHPPEETPDKSHDESNGSRSERRDRDRDLDRERKRRNRSRERRHERDADGDEEMKSPKSDRASANGSNRSRKRSRSRDSGKRHSRRDRDDPYRSSGGDYYRGPGRTTRSRSRSPYDDRYYRPTGRSRRDERDDDRRSSKRDRDGRRRSPSSSRRRSRSPEPQLTEDERDRRTVFVQQLAARLRTKELIAFFEKVGPVKEAQIVKDRVSGRSKGRGRSRGYGFVQFRDPNQAREALEKMNGFDLAGRPIRVGLGNDKFTPESTANLLQRFQGQGAHHNFQGSLFSGHGGRGAQAGGSGHFDRAGGRDNDKAAGGASALDDTDVAGVNFNNYSRDALMRKLARTDEPAIEPTPDEKRKVPKPQVNAKPLPVSVNMASRCVLLRNMFDPAEEEGESWIKELEDDVRAECEDKYGHVVHIALDPNTQGDIYLKFDRVQGGENAIKGLNGRFFGGRQISAQPVVDAVYSSLFTRSKAI
ncbi:RNA splicing factor [Histoplasma capsulatum H143]|uniref:RNA splicing factor n=1 Tax=Ajellomyces capsulatus (strain H143) TaxID=544712 RepID=C6HNJ1_AJECH|nr:RNA splicing factor [Histoplasma capsulatum H143]